MGEFCSLAKKHYPRKDQQCGQWDVCTIDKIVIELQCHERWPRAEARRMLPGGMVQCDTRLSATTAFFFIISKHHNQSKKQILLFTLAQIKYSKPQYITAQEKYTVVY